MIMESLKSCSVVLVDCSERFAIHIESQKCAHENFIDCWIIMRAGNKDFETKFLKYLLSERVVSMEFYDVIKVKKNFFFAAFMTN